MSKKSNLYEDYVFSLSKKDFNKLIDAINKRMDEDKFGYTTFEDAAIYYGRKPVCPKCGSTSNYLDGNSSAVHKRYRCKDCGMSFTLLSNSIFNSAKIPLHKLTKYIELMSFNVPLELMSEVLDISSNTAELWRKKIFNTVNNYQDHLVLSDTIWIDETYIEDYEIEAISKGKHLRGLSRSKMCIVVAIDNHKNMVAKIAGHGKPSSKRILVALKPHIKEGSHIIHDGDHSHYKLIQELNCSEELYKANTKDELYIEKMSLINNMCSWLKRYLRRFLGMDINNLQSYLNWFIYLQRVKAEDDKWPKNNRILRHLLLSDVKFTRKY